MTQSTPADEKAKADAELAQHNALQKKREVEEWNSDLARRRREAEHESAIAKANKDATEARQSQWTSVVSKLADVPRGETKVSGEQPILGSALAMKGLRAAAEKIAEVVRTLAAGSTSILVTSEADLATADAAYHTVDACLEDLSKAADVLLKDPAEIAAEAIGETLAAVAGLIPAVVGMLSAQRTVATFPTSGDDLSAAAAVLGALVDALPHSAIRHDNFRLRVSAKVDEKLAEVRAKRHALVAKEQELAGAQGPATAIHRERIKVLVEAINGFDTKVREVPSGSTRSALTNAALYEGLHDGVIEHVLLVKGIAGSATQVVNDRPLWWEDKFSVVATTNITYLLLKTVDNRIASAGTETATVTVNGTIGDRLEPDSETIWVGRNGGAHREAVSGSHLAGSGDRQPSGEPGRNGGT